MRTTKLQRRIVANLNAIIHSQNLYYLRPDGRKSRLVYARVEGGAIVMDDINACETVTLAACDGTMKNGFGRDITMEDLTHE